MTLVETGKDATARPEAPAEVAARRLYYVDLILGAWRPREAAHQLAAAIEVRLAPMPGPDAEECATTLGAAAIDVEAVGDPAVNQAFDDARRIVAAVGVGATVVVLTPRFDLPLRADNEWFFHFFQKLGQPVVSIGKDPPLKAIPKSPFERRRSTVMPEWDIRPDKVGPDRTRLLRLFPGLMPRGIAEAARMLDGVVGLVPAGPGHFLVPTAFRDIDPRYAARDFDALEEIEAADPGFRALAQSFCTAHFAEADALSDLALGSFRAGARDLATELALRARSVGRNPGEVARAELVTREIALSERRFADLAAAPDLSPRAPAELVARWSRLKEKARFASGDPADAEDVVAPALRRLGSTAPIDSAELRRLNQIVMMRAAAGKADEALALARRIAAGLTRRAERADRRLVFENAMTLARLYQARGEAPARAAEVERAFTTALGARSPSDILRLNVMRAKGDPNPERARLAWLRAALAWLGGEPREGLSRDAVLTLVEDPDLPPVELEAAVATALAEGLEKAWPEIAEQGPERLLDIRPAGTLPSLPAQRLYGGPGASVLWTPETLPARSSPVPSVERLVRRAYAGIAALCPAFAEIAPGTVLVDFNLGRDLPAAREEALSVALRARLAEFSFGESGGRLDPLERDRLTSHLEVRLSPIVARVIGTADGVVVSFKRYLAPKRLTGPEGKLAGYVAKSGGDFFPGLPPALGFAPEETERLVRGLEKESILRADMKPA